MTLPIESSPAKRQRKPISSLRNVSNHTSMSAAAAASSPNSSRIAEHAKRGEGNAVAQQKQRAFQEANKLEFNRALQNAAHLARNKDFPPEHDSPKSKPAHYRRRSKKVAAICATYSVSGVSSHTNTGNTSSSSTNPPPFGSRDAKESSSSGEHKVKFNLAGLTRERTTTNYSSGCSAAGSSPRSKRWPLNAPSGVHNVGGFCSSRAGGGDGQPSVRGRVVVGESFDSMDGSCLQLKTKCRVIREYFKELFCGKREVLSKTTRRKVRMMSTADHEGEKAPFPSSCPFPPPGTYWMNHHRWSLAERGGSSQMGSDDDCFDEGAKL